MDPLTGQVAVVTGAGSGIGRALALQLDAAGCRLALADLDEAGLRDTADALSGRALTQTLDVADRAAVHAFADIVRQQCGPVDLVINNAGVSVVESVADIRYEDFEWLMGINFWGVVYGTKAFLPAMLEQGRGTIVNISSVFGIIAVPSQSAYNAAKFAVRGFTEALRHELDGTGVRAICVHPGGIRTNIVKRARVYKDHKGRSDHALLMQEFERGARTTPEQAAATILEGIRKRRPRILIGADAWFIDRMQRWMPESYWPVMRRLIDRLTR